MTTCDGTAFYCYFGAACKANLVIINWSTPISYDSVLKIVNLVSSNILLLLQLTKNMLNIVESKGLSKNLYGFYNPFTERI